MILSKTKVAWDLSCLSVVKSSGEKVPQNESDNRVKKLSYTAEQDIKMAYKNHFKTCCRYATKKIKDAQVAEDIVADTFLRLILQAGGVNGAEIENLLYTLIDSKCNDHIEEQRLIAEGISAFEELTPSDEAEIEAEFKRVMHDEIRKLPPQRKQIMLKLYMEGLSSEQVAQRMKISAQTVRNQKVRALKVLRNNILRKLFL